MVESIRSCLEQCSNLKNTGAGLSQSGLRRIWLVGLRGMACYPLVPVGVVHHHTVLEHCSQRTATNCGGSSDLGSPVAREAGDGTV